MDLNSTLLVMEEDVSYTKAEGIITEGGTLVTTNEEAYIPREVGVLMASLEEVIGVDRF